MRDTTTRSTTAARIKETPLSDGVVCKGTVMCSWHGWCFSLEDGHHLGGSSCAVGTYPVRVVGDEIEVGVEE